MKIIFESEQEREDFFVNVENCCPHCIGFENKCMEQVDCEECWQKIKEKYTEVQYE